MSAPLRRLAGCRLWRSGHARRIQPPSGEKGFVLPLAFGVSLMLLIGAFSLQTLALQARLGLRRVETRALQEDALATAAQQLVAALNLRHPCLLALPLQQWTREGLLCASALQQQALAEGSAGAARWRLIDWQPAPRGASLQIELDALAPDVPRRRGSFVVALQSEPLRAQPPRLLALRGVVP